MWKQCSLIGEHLPLVRQGFVFLQKCSELEHERKICPS